MTGTKQNHTDHKNEGGENMINFFIGTLVQIYKFTKKDESRTVFRRRFVARSGLRRPDQPMISIFTSRRMSAAGTSITWHFSFSSNTGFTLRPPTFALSIFPAAGS